jgi:hypothetical protein
VLAFGIIFQALSLTIVVGGKPERVKRKYNVCVDSTVLQQQLNLAVG